MQFHGRVLRADDSEASLVLLDFQFGGMLGFEPLGPVEDEEFYNQKREETSQDEKNPNQYAAQGGAVRIMDLELQWNGAAW